MASRKPYRRALPSLILLLIIASACGGSGKQAASKPSTLQAVRDTATWSLPLPRVPESLRTPEERATFVARHFWDHMDWQDTLLLSSERIMGESMANFGMFLSLVPDDVARESIATAAKGATANPVALHTLADYAYSYFYYHPDAPQYDAELYLKFIDVLTDNHAIDEADHLRMEERRREIMKNRIGTPATDFRYIGTDGATRQLAATASGSQLRILMLYDPDCPTCEEAVEMMRESAPLAEAIRRGDVSVIAINAYGQNEGGPAKTESTFPADWIAGYSPSGEIDTDEIYIIRATPAIYLIDSAGVIVGKDLSLRHLNEFLSNLGSFNQLP